MKREETERSVSLRSVRSGFVLTLALALLPVAVLGVIQGSIALADRTRSDRSSFIALTREVARDEAEMLTRIRTLMVSLAHDVAATPNPQERCETRLQRFRDAVSEMQGLGVFGGDGALICAIGDLGLAPEFLPGRPDLDFRLAVSDSATATALAAIGRAETADGAIVRAVGNLTLGPLRAVARELSIGRPTDIAFVDGAGRYLDGSTLTPPDGLARIVAAMPDESDTSDRLVTQSFTDQVDGATRLNVIASLLPGEVYLLASRPDPAILGRDGLALWLQIGVPIALWLTALVAAWWAVDWLVLRWVRKHRRLVRRYAAGDLAAQTDLDGAPDEFREFGERLEDMAARIQARETELEVALAEKDAMVKEIHHRVKNNLQVITSLLNLQSKTAGDAGEQRIIGDVQTRINALATIHRALYGSDDLELVSLRGLLGDLAGHLEDLASSRQRRVRIVVDCGDDLILSDKAVPLALLITEAVTNAVKHAFAEGQDGAVRVTVLPSSDGQDAIYDIRVVDDGVGPKPAGAEEAGIGSTLMRAFARQVGGTLSSGPGEQGFVVELNGAKLR